MLHRSWHNPGETFTTPSLYVPEPSVLRTYYYVLANPKKSSGPIHSLSAYKVQFGRASWIGPFGSTQPHHRFVRNIYMVLLLPLTLTS
jgi:hypothetical protein